MIVTADEVDDAQNLDIKLWVNGEVRQNHNTSDMGRTVEETVEFITWITTMKAGDVIATGTNHVGLGPIQHGDVITEEIGDFGLLTVMSRTPWRGRGLAAVERMRLCSRRSFQELDGGTSPLSVSLPHWGKRWG